MRRSLDIIIDDSLRGRRQWKDAGGTSDFSIRFRPRKRAKDLRVAWCDDDGSKMRLSVDMYETIRMMCDASKWNNNTNLKGLECEQW